MSAPAPLAQSNQKPSWEDYDAVLRTAERSRTVGDLARAHTFYARLVELDPKDTRGWVGMAMTAQSLDERIISWGYALAVTPESWEAHLHLDAHVDERITSSGIADAPVLVALGRTLAEIGQRASALRLLVRATELDPTNVEGWLWRGGVSPDPGEIVSCLEQALALEPENEQAKTGLAWALEKQSVARAPVSESAVREAREAFQVGQNAFQAGDLPSAHQAFMRATEINPHADQAWYWRGSTAPNTDQALVAMEQAIKLNPQNRDAKEARWWLRAKKFRECLPTVKPKPSPLVIPLDATLETESPDDLPDRSRLWLFLALALTIVAVSMRVVWLIIGR